MFFTLAFVLIGYLGLAQPSESTLKSKIKSDSPSVTSIEFTGEGNIVKEWEDGALYLFNVIFYSFLWILLHQAVSRHFISGYFKNWGISVPIHTFT